jgi:hypothetical protein
MIGSNKSFSGNQTYKQNGFLAFRNYEFSSGVMMPGIVSEKLEIISIMTGQTVREVYTCRSHLCYAEPVQFN